MFKRIYRITKSLFSLLKGTGGGGAGLWFGRRRRRDLFEYDYQKFSDISAADNQRIEDFISEAETY